MSAAPNCEHDKLVCPYTQWAAAEIERLTAENVKLHTTIDELAAVIRGEENGREYAAAALEPKP